MTIDDVSEVEAQRPTEDRLGALRSYYTGNTDGAGDVEDLFREIDALRSALDSMREENLTLRAALSDERASRRGALRKALDWRAQAEVAESALEAAEAELDSMREERDAEAASARFEAECRYKEHDRAEAAEAALAACEERVEGMEQAAKIVNAETDRLFSEGRKLEAERDSMQEKVQEQYELTCEAIRHGEALEAERDSMREEADKWYRLAVTTLMEANDTTESNEVLIEQVRAFINSPLWDDQERARARFDTLARRLEACEEREEMESIDPKVVRDLETKLKACEEALRAEFLRILPDEDYELVNGIKCEDGVAWAWRSHPWFDLVGLTEAECVAALAPPDTAP